MKTQFNYRNYRNNYNMRSVYQPLTMVLAMSVALYNFGVKAMSFLSSLVTTSDGPFAGLTRRQMKDMWWLRYLYPC
jgi:hypothetical protein